MAVRYQDPIVRAKKLAADREYAKTSARKARQNERAREYAKTPEFKAKRREYMAEYNARPENQEKLKAKALRWREKDPERAKEVQRHYRVSEKGRLHNRLQASRRRARFEGKVTREEWLAVVLAWGSRCAYCQVTDKPLTIDHVIPVSKGGRHEVSNIVPACKCCNDRKNDLVLSDALVRLGISPEVFVARLEASRKE